ncbi:MAG: transposase zinc-binding domain-containing protein [Oligoflexales bacterium]|nr:transposase zinc-binding domain-containing protein [Oligoflexales bacterium]
MMGWFYALAMGPLTHKIYERRKPEETLLYQTLASHLNTFLAHLAADGKAIPKHVEKELWAFLECGVLAYGFVRVKCADCTREHLLAFSCKKRGFCPSCGGKRMAETAAHLIDNILPCVKVRQYVLSVPIPLRYWMASSKKLLAKVHKIFTSEVESFYVDKGAKNRSGSVTFVQRFGSALNLNVHFHLLQMEGAYEGTGLVP